MVYSGPGRSECLADRGTMSKAVAKRTASLQSQRRKAARRIRDGYERAGRGEKECAHGAEEWAAGTLQMAIGMAEVRRTFSSDREFGAWVDEQGYDFNANDRAALIAMGQHPDKAAKALAETTRRSLQLIWREEIQLKFALPSPRPHRPAQRCVSASKPEESLAVTRKYNEPMRRSVPIRPTPAQSDRPVLTISDMRNDALDRIGDEFQAALDAVWQAQDNDVIPEPKGKLLRAIGAVQDWLNERKGRP